MSGQTKMLKKICAIHGVPLTYGLRLMDVRKRLFDQKREALEQQFLLGVSGTCADCPRSIHGVHPELCTNADRYDHQLAADPTYQLLRMEEHLLHTIDGWRPALSGTNQALPCVEKAGYAYSAYVRALSHGSGSYPASIAGMYRCLQAAMVRQERARFQPKGT